MEKKKPDITIKLKQDHTLEVHDWTNGHKEVAAATDDTLSPGTKLQEDDEFTWVLPDESEIPEYRKIHYATDELPQEVMKKQRTSWSWIPFLLAFSLAIGLGLLFGYGLIWMASSEDNRATQTVQNVSVEPKNTTTAPGTTAPKKTIAIVQAGVFSDKAAASAFQQQLQAKGVESKAFTVKKQTAVVVGVASTVASAKQLATAYGNIDVFEKEFTLPEANWTGLSQTEQSFVNGISPLLLEISDWQVTAATETKVASVTTLLQELAVIKGIENEELVSIQKEVGKLGAMMQKEDKQANVQTAIMTILAMLYRM